MAGSKMGSSAKGRQHSRHGNKYLRQWERTAKNTRKSWDRHLKNHPNDAQAKIHIGIAKDKLRSFK